MTITCATVVYCGCQIAILAQDVHQHYSSRDLYHIQCTHLLVNRLNEVKRNERDDKWFLEFSTEMIVCGSVIIVNMSEA